MRQFRKRQDFAFSRVHNPVGSMARREHSTTQYSEEIDYRSHECGPHSVKKMLGGIDLSESMSQPSFKADEKRRHLHSLCWWTSWWGNPVGTETEATEQPDTVAEQLMRSGDVETNPGPVVTRSRSGRGLDTHELSAEGRQSGETNSEPTNILSNSGRGPDSRKTRSRTRAVARKGTGTPSRVPIKSKSGRGPDTHGTPDEAGHRNGTSEPGVPRCRRCNKKTREEAIKCKECKGSFHDNHTGETREACKKIHKFKRPWCCPYCRLGIEPEASVQGTVMPGRCMAAKCRKPKITSRSFLSCTQCKGQLHLQESCSGMKRRRIELIDRATWRCEGCRGVAGEESEDEEDSVPTFKLTSNTKFVDKLDIMQWNADAIGPKQDELERYVIAKDIDIFLIQETKMIKKDKKPKFAGYRVLRQDRLQWKGKENNRGGGLLIGIKRHIPFRKAKIDIRSNNDEITESLSIEIPLKDKQKLRLTNIYIPPIRTPKEGEGRQRLAEVSMEKWPSEQYDCIFGDVNAHSPLWNNDREAADDRGDDIEEWIAATGMMTLNDGSTTRTNRSCRKPEYDESTQQSELETDEPTEEPKDTTPDISLIHSSLAGKFTWSVHEDLGSDHKPIIASYREMNSVPALENKPMYKWNFKQADWSKFTQEVEDMIPSRYHRTSTNKLEKKVRNIITKAAKKHIGKKKVTDKTKPGFTPEIKQAIKERNKLREARAANRKPWIEACNKVRDMIKAWREKQWKEYVSGLDMSVNPSQIWRTIHALEGKYPAKVKNEVLTVNNVALVEDKDKAEAFATTYRGFSHLPRPVGKTENRREREIRRTVRRRMKQETPESHESEAPITMEELELAIEEAGNNKASGDDDIPYELIKHTGPKTRELILHIFNRCWEGENIPQKWLTAIIKTLLKDGKDPKYTVSYRGISLTACWGKLLEKIIANRLTCVLERRGLLADSQAGFRQNRCTTDQILNMTQLATNHIQSNDKNNATIITFFDYAKAYDKVW